MPDEPKKPVHVVDPEEATTPKPPTATPQTNAVRFRFNEIGTFKFKDGSSYHTQARQATITDPVLIKNLKEAAKNPSNKIFIETE